MPVFLEKNSDEWIFGAERYSLVNQLTKEEELETVALCFEGEALSSVLQIPNQDSTNFKLLSGAMIPRLQGKGLYHRWREKKSIGHHNKNQGLHDPYVTAEDQQTTLSKATYAYQIMKSPRRISTPTTPDSRNPIRMRQGVAVKGERQRQSQSSGSSSRGMVGGNKLADTTEIHMNKQLGLVLELELAQTIEDKLPMRTWGDLKERMA